MSTASFFLRTALHNLRRGGQRAWAAMLCITFGVMSLTGMLLLSRSIDSAMVKVPSHRLGADLSLTPRSGGFISARQAAGLQALQEAGTIQRYTLLAQTNTLVFFLPGSGEMHYTASGMGIDPQGYPLAGSFTLAEPAGASPADLLQGPGDVVVTTDLAQKEGLRVGDALRLADLDTGAPIEARVRGIASDTPNHQGGKVYYTRETAAVLAGVASPENVALANTVHRKAALESLDDAGWFTIDAVGLAEGQKGIDSFIDTGLRGAGILGLLVGGIGIANTMQVLLRRRRVEVAVWKTLGYTAGELQGLFALEAGLLGAAGSQAGAALGVMISQGLVNLFRATGNLLFVWTLAPLPVILAALAGTATAVIFALWSIVTASRVQPLALLRREALEARRLPWAQAAGLGLALGLPFLALTGLVMGSLLNAVWVLLFVLAGLASLGGLLGGLGWAAMRLLPGGRFPLARLAQNSLRRRGPALVFAMIALFAGVVSLALGVVVTQSAGREMSERTLRMSEYTIQIVAPAGEAEGVRRSVESQPGVRESLEGWYAPVASIRPLGGEGKTRITPVIVGREQPQGYRISGAAWGSEPQGVYLYEADGVPAGAQVEVTLADGTTRLLKVVGTYQVDWDGAALPPQLGPLAPAGLAGFQPATALFFLRAAPGQAAQVSEKLGQALPEATVVNLLAYARRFTQTYRNLFVLAVAMAGLALLAGVLLVANSVSLAMLDRRYEIGVLKAVGYARGHVLASLVIEYSLVALIATATGLAGVQALLWVITQTNPAAQGLLVMPALTTAQIAALGVGLVLATLLAVAWGPTQVSPVSVLSDRE